MKDRYFVHFDKILDMIGYIVLGLVLSLPIFFLLCGIAEILVDDSRIQVAANITIFILTMIIMSAACLFGKTRNLILIIASRFGSWLYGKMNKLSDYMEAGIKILFFVIGLVVVAFLLAVLIGWIASLSISAVIFIVLLFLLLK